MEAAADSRHHLCRTQCCGQFGVEDNELLDFYFDPNDLSKLIFMDEHIERPFCGAKSLLYEEVTDLAKIPEARGNGRRPRFESDLPCSAAMPHPPGLLDAPTRRVTSWSWLAAAKVTRMSLSTKREAARLGFHETRKGTREHVGRLDFSAGHGACRANHRQSRN